MTDPETPIVGGVIVTHLCTDRPAGLFVGTGVVADEVQDIVRHTLPLCASARVTVWVSVAVADWLAISGLK